MTSYYRPIAQTDAARPEGALPLAGHARIWFDRVEHLQRGEASQILPASAVPQDLRERLCAKRAAPAGLSFDRPVLMGVLNTTPDSFSDGGKFDTLQAACAHGAEMVLEGADMLDVGGESTRPGAVLVPAEEELSRTVPIIGALKEAGIAVPISIDTRKAAVAEGALAAGASVLNDVSALSFDAQMVEIARKSGAPICLMHAQGDPRSMQKDPRYDDVLLDVYDYLEKRICVAVQAGLSRDQLIIDPGIGFGKTAEHNLALIRGLSLFHGLGCPVLLGVSRKRFIGTIGNAPEPARRAAGSVAVALNGLSQAVQIIRAHDIEPHAQAFALWAAMLNKEQDE
jgi:dihydropteroate synthase